MVKINTNHISPSPNLLFLKTAVRVSIAEKLFAEWENDWYREVQGCTLYKIALIPSKKVFHLYNKLLK